MLRITRLETLSLSGESHNLSGFFLTYVFDNNSLGQFESHKKYSVSSSFSRV